MIQWPGGVNVLALLAHEQTVLAAAGHGPRNRVYVSPPSWNSFIDGFLRFSKGLVVSDDRQAPGVEKSASRAMPTDGCASTRPSAN